MPSFDDGVIAGFDIGGETTQRKSKAAADVPAEVGLVRRLARNGSRVL